MTALVRPAMRAPLAGLAFSLMGVVTGTAIRRSKAGPGLLVTSLVLTGLSVGLLLGTARVAALEDSALCRHLGETADFELVITGAVRQSSGWQSATVTVKRCETDDSVEGEKAWLEVTPEGSAQVLRQGQVVQCAATIEAPEGGGSSGYDQRRWLLQQGVGAVLEVDDPESVFIVGRRGGAAGLFDRLRRAAREHLSMGPSEEVDEVLEGVVTGETAGIREDWLEAFRRSGTAHMLSVSGLHVASLAAIMIGLARLLRAPRWAGFVLAGAAAVLMIPFVGPSPPIIRAATMIVIVLFGRWVGRGRDPWQILALAAAAILAINPFAVHDVGFQLSFSALAGIIALVTPLQRLLRRLPEGMAANVAVSLAAGLGTAPVALVQFGRTSLISPLANLLVVPMLPVVTGLGMASVFTGLVWHGFSVALDTLASLPLMWTVVVSRMAAKAPVLESGHVGLAIAASLGAAITLPVALAVMGRFPRTPFDVPLPFWCRSLGWFRRHRPKRRRFAIAGALAVVALGSVLGLVSWSAGGRGLEAAEVALGGRGWPETVELRVLDIGQGNAVLVRTPERHTLLFDGGPEGCDLAGKLRSLGVHRLDVVVISHPHADHFAGLLEALPELEVGTLVDHVRVGSTDSRGPPSSRGSAGQTAGEARQYVELRRQLAERGCECVLASSGDKITLDGVVCRCLAPVKPLVMIDGEEPWVEQGGTPTGDELNAASLVVVLTAGSVNVIIPGDAEADTLGRYDLPRAEALVVPHHGSRGAITPALLRRLGVRLAIVSVGASNTFGHPDAETVALLDEGVDTSIRTDLAGWVCCSLQSEQISVTTERTPFW